MDFLPELLHFSGLAALTLEEMWFGGFSVLNRLVCIILVALIACSRGEELDGRDLRREAVERRYGITAGVKANLRDGSRVVFFGDSITAGGVEEDGYVTLIADALEGLYPGREINVVGSGVVGDKVSDLIVRLRRDVLARNPTHVVIYVGVNDVASLGSSNAALTEGEKAYREDLIGLVTRIRDAGAWVMICTPGVIGENLDDGSFTNLALERYASAAREVAAENQTGLCDLRSEFSEHLAGRNRNGRHSGILTVDGIHLNSAGNRFVAGTILRALVRSATSVPVRDVSEKRA